MLNYFLGGIRALIFLFIILANLHHGVCVLLIIGLIMAFGLCIYILALSIGALGFICKIVFLSFKFSRALHIFMLSWICL
jgi:hypothetical protein